MTDTRDALETEAINLAHNIFRRLADIENFAVTTAAELRSEILASATLHVRNLHARPTDDTAAIGAARMVCRALHGDTLPPDAWWRTKLGADVAWAIGFPRDTATVAEVVAVLGCSRSYVLRLIRDGKLLTAAGGGVVAESLRDYVRRTPAAYNRGGNTTGRWA